MLCKLNHTSKMYYYSQNLKRGIFWLGKDATISIKQNKENEFWGEYNGKNKSENDFINIQINEVLEDGLMINSGVTINISECYMYSRVITENNWNDINKSLGSKFSYYLSNNKFGECKIIIYSDLFSNKDLGREIISNKMENNETSIFKIDIVNKKVNSDKLSLIIDNNLQNMQDDKSFYDFKFKVLNNQKLVFNDEIIFNNCSLPVKVYILKKPNINNAGQQFLMKIFLFIIQIN